ncbi:MAG: hypothetical protein QY325_07170 [Flavobacteriales bacterium]|nr:MAG: hypothetical protein QY325_07170 [Flavobacteriales bacterium]
MVNQLVLLINVVGILLVDAFLAANLSITQNVPAALAPGSEVKVTVTVEKGDLTGFAKLQIDLPDGLTATAIETKGASFTFSDGKAKFIWMSLPASPTFKVTYTLSAAANASGIKTINGRLSYIEDNERKVFELPASTVDLGAPGAVAAITQPITAEDPTANDVVSAAGAAPVGTIPVMVIDDASGVAPIQGAGGVTGQRTITPVTEKEMLVEVVVSKGSIRGFGKLQEVIPQGFTAMEKNSAEAIFTTQDRIVKFVWLNLPASSEVKIVYKLRANERPDGEYTIDGEFGYLLNDETQKAVLGSSKFIVGARAFEALAQDTSSMGQQEVEDPELALRLKEEAERKARAEAEARAAEAVKPVVKEKPETATAAQQPKAAGRIPAPEKGVTYKVQITAAHREVGKAYFKARHNYGGDFQIERHQGWIKYVTGSYAEYKDARDQRVGYVQAGHNFPGPFVTAYNNGERITVQEALLITKQQWVQ